MQGSISVTCATTEHVSLAYHQNSIPFVSEIVVENASDENAADLTLTVTSHPPVVRPATFRIDRIGAGQIHRLEMSDIHLDFSALAGFTEASALQLKVEVEAAGPVWAECVQHLRLLPPSHWGGGRSAPELVAAFVRPNDPAVDVVLRDAATKLAGAGCDQTLNGYSGNPKARIWEMA